MKSGQSPATEEVVPQERHLETVLCYWDSSFKIGGGGGREIMAYNKSGEDSRTALEEC